MVVILLARCSFVMRRSARSKPRATRAGGRIAAGLQAHRASAAVTRALPTQISRKGYRDGEQEQAQA